MTLHEHADFGAHVDVTRLVNEEGGPTVGYQAEVRVWCQECGEDFVFVGPYPLGVSPARPTRSVDGTCLSAPLRPKSAPANWGLDRPGMVGRFEGPTPPEPN